MGPFFIGGKFTVRGAGWLSLIFNHRTFRPVTRIQKGAGWLSFEPWKKGAIIFFAPFCWVNRWGLSSYRARWCLPAISGPGHSAPTISIVPNRSQSFPIIPTLTGTDTMDRGDLVPPSNRSHFFFLRERLKWERLKIASLCRYLPPLWRFFGLCVGNG